MRDGTLLAAVDLGSNSFRLQVGRVSGDLVYPLDGLKETVRLASGLTRDKRLDAAAQARGLGALARFGERLRGFKAEGVRAVGTNTLRVAKNAAEFIDHGAHALGFPIEVIGGREEARLIYLGAVHSLQHSTAKRLVIDIGGGSTEFIIGRGTEPIHLESLYMGCVGFSLRYFPDGRVQKAALKEAILAARLELQAIEREFIDTGWDEVIGSSGTARAIADVLQVNGLSDGSITRDGLDVLRGMLLKAGNVGKLEARGVAPDRVAVLGGGFAIMSAIFAELGLERMGYADGALRLGVLYDILGRAEHHDQRDASAREFTQRYRVDLAQADRVERLAQRILAQVLPAAGDTEALRQQLQWAAKLHEIGISIAHAGYHKHSAYILRFADMPGFSKGDQERLSYFVLGHRGKLGKVANAFASDGDWAVLFSLRVAALLSRSRADLPLPELAFKATTRGFQMTIDGDWLAANPLTESALEQEVQEWRSIGFTFKLRVVGGETRAGD
jgi:exopolyphosphatase/guanosine-5'-triphosphate,3'-diphosphate pyrophosphatase